MTQTSRRGPGYLLAVGPLLLGLTVAGCGGARAPEGSELYHACVACHGPDGSGNLTLRAPRIAGLPAWYVGVQLRRFKSDKRGKHPDDADGLRMRAMSRQMLSDEEIDAVAQHVSQLSPAKGAPPASPSVQSAEAAAGKSAYAPCAECHGDHGEGREELRAAPLALLEGWYIDAQFTKFKTGVRGTVADDNVGARMREKVSTVKPGDLPKVLAYLQTLSK